MSYLDNYKKRLMSMGNSIKNHRVVETKRKIRKYFKEDEAYKLATLIKNDGTKEELDTRITNVDRSIIEKHIYLLPDTVVDLGNYIKYKDRTYIVYEFEDNILSPMARCYLCNNTINSSIFKEPIPAYCTNSTYGDKGVIETTYINEIDGKILLYIQNNKETKSIPLDMRFIFDNDKNQVYKVVKTETVTTGNLRKIVVAKDDYSEKDDLANNIAYNRFLDNSIKEDGTQDFNIISTNGQSLIRKYATNKFTIVNKDGKTTSDKWGISLDYNGNDTNSITIKSQTDNSIELINNIGYSDKQIKITFENAVLSKKYTLDIKLVVK